MRFQAQNYNKTRTVKESQLVWYPIYSTVRQEYASSVQITNLKLQDTPFIQLSTLTQLDYSIFGVKRHEVRPYEYFDSVHCAIAYEFDLNLYHIDREAYNILDWLGDNGGLFIALLILLKGVLILFNYQAFENYLVKQLFRSQRRREHQ